MIEMPLASIPNDLRKYFRPKRSNGPWTLRNVVVWHKSNPMPSSVRDRFTVDFEYLYFFTKGPKYYFEQQLEPCTAKNKGDIKRAEGSAQGRNKRCVWKIPTQPFPGAHFAVFPEKLIQTPIKAGCPKDVCLRCGKPRRLIKKVPKSPDTFNNRIRKQCGSAERQYVIYEGCFCGTGFKPGVVLDPFIGAGTTAAVAKKLGRSFIGMDVSATYVSMAEKRLERLPGRKERNCITEESRRVNARL